MSAKCGEQWSLEDNESWSLCFDEKEDGQSCPYYYDGICHLEDDEYCPMEECG